MTPARFARMAGALLLLGGAFWLGWKGGLEATGEVSHFIGALLVMALGYLLSMRVGGFPPVVIGIVAVAVRLWLLGMPPGNDVYRYAWEGRVLAAGINPYQHAPESEVLAQFRDGIWQRVEHRECSAIYPPLAELGFAAIAGGGGGILALKWVVLLADGAIGFLLARAFGAARALLYLWNPLVLCSFAAGGHYDSLFLLPLVAAWLAWRRCPHGVSTAAWLGTAVAMKWLAAPLVGWLAWQHWRRGARRAAWHTLALGALPVALAWLALCVWTQQWEARLFPGSFVRYARSAECIPALVAAVIPATQYLNELYILPIVLAWCVAIHRCSSFESAAEWMFFSVFLLSPMLHAWYFAWLVPFAVLTRNRGAVVLSVSGIAYFWVYFRFLSPGGIWTYSGIERVVLWLPFIAGFCWSKFGSHSPESKPPLSNRHTVR